VGIWDAKRGIYRKNRSPYTAKGTSDIIGIFHGYMICLEIKTKKGRVSPEQKAFLEEMTALGAFCRVIRSLDEAVSFLTLVSAHVHEQQNECDKPHNES
jgi:penicillin-binding protein-related factor A (putative recombinase)